MFLFIQFIIWNIEASRIIIYDKDNVMNSRMSVAHTHAHTQFSISMIANLFVFEIFTRRLCDALLKLVFYLRILLDMCAFSKGKSSATFCKSSIFQIDLDSSILTAVVN